MMLDGISAKVYGMKKMARAMLYWCPLMLRLASRPSIFALPEEGQT
jgi:hypothetical protein